MPIIFERRSLKTLNTMGIGGEGDIYYPKTLDELKQALLENPKVHLLGGGSNTIFPDGVFSKKIIGTQFLNKIYKEKDQIQAECGVRLAKLFDFGSGVPATVGAAVRINFGALGDEVGHYVREVDLFDRAGHFLKWNADQCEFGYRTSNIKKNNYVVLSALFKKPEKYNPLEVIKWRNEKQPLSFKNSGSVFKNPSGHKAGQLIDQAGLKGARVGDVGVWDGHGNIFVNYGQGTAKDLKELVEQVRKKVFENTGVQLEIELEFVESIENNG